jgi:hypothetical protein
MTISSFSSFIKHYTPPTEPTTNNLTVQTSALNSYYPKGLVISNLPDVLDYAINFLGKRSPRLTSNTAFPGHISVQVNPATGEKVERIFDRHGVEKTLSVTLLRADNVIQVVAGDTAWYMLRSNGEVWSSGDARFPGVLGREVTKER